MPIASAIASPAVLTHRRASDIKRRADVVAALHGARRHLEKQLAEFAVNHQGFRDTVTRLRGLRRALLLVVVATIFVVAFDYVFATGGCAAHMMEDFWQSRYRQADMPPWVVNAGALFLVVCTATATVFFSTRVFDTTELEARLREADVEEDAGLRRRIGTRRGLKALYFVLLAGVLAVLWSAAYDKAQLVAENGASSQDAAATQESRRDAVSSRVNASSDPAGQNAKPIAPVDLSASERLTLKLTAVALVFVFAAHIGLSCCPTYGIWHLPRPVFNEQAAARRARRLSIQEKTDAVGLWQQIDQLPATERQAAIELLPGEAIASINSAMGRSVIAMATTENSRIDSSAAAATETEPDDGGNPLPNDDLADVL